MADQCLDCGKNAAAVGCTFFPHGKDDDLLPMWGKGPFPEQDDLPFGVVVDVRRAIDRDRR